jgi:hypothetical protein
VGPPARVGARGARRRSTAPRARGTPCCRSRARCGGCRSRRPRCEPVVARRPWRSRAFLRIEAHVRVRGRPRRRHRAPLRAAGLADDARHVVGDLGPARSAGRGPALRRRAATSQPSCSERWGTASHAAPAVDGAGGARREAVTAGVARARSDDVVACVVGDRLGLAHRLAGVAADADLRVDEVLSLEEGVGWLRRSLGQLKRTYSKSAGWLLMPRAGGAM